MLSSFPLLNPQLYGILPFLSMVVRLLSKLSVLTAAATLASAIQFLDLCVKRDSLKLEAVSYSDAPSSKKNSYCSMVLHIDELLVLEEG